MPSKKNDNSDAESYLDYLSLLSDMVRNKIKNPKIIEMEIFEEILKASKEDPKTGLYNSKHFAELLSNEINKAKRNHFPLSILFMDIDNFKECNDIFGHTVGDELLRLLSGVLKKMIRGEDIAGRFGGDEFIVMLSHVEKNEAFFVADRIVEIFKKASLKNKELKKINKQITLSIGIASFPADAESAETLIKRADKALYEAKCNGKDRIAYYQIEKSKLEISENKRKKFRYDCFGKEIFFNITNSKYRYKGFLHNISEDGIKIEIPNVTVLLRGLPVKIEIDEKKVNAFNISGEILYAKKQESSLFAGLKFNEKDKIKEMENLKKFIKVQKCKEIDE